MQVDRHGIVGLVGRALRAKLRRGKQEERKRGESEAFAAKPR
jgi:hypothetical protein